MIVKKARGGEEKYKSYKVVRSCRVSGFSKSQGKTIEKRARERIGGEIDAKELEKIIYQEMKKFNEKFAMKFRLRESIAALDPNKHEFELFIARLFQEMGYKAERSPKPKPEGKCIEHEIDVLAKKGDKTHIIECKHHYHYHRFTGLGVPMREFARLLDLREGYQKGKKHSINPKKCWVFTNTKLSQHAKDYSQCQGIELIGWNYPEESLAKLAEKFKVYPATILMIDEKTRKELSKHKILTVRDLLESETHNLDIMSSKLTELMEKAENLLR